MQLRHSGEHTRRSNGSISQGERGKLFHNYDIEDGRRSSGVYGLDDLASDDDSGEELGGISGSGSGGRARSGSHRR